MLSNLHICPKTLANWFSNRPVTVIEASYNSDKGMPNTR